MKQEKIGRRRSKFVCMTALTLLFVSTRSFAQTVPMTSAQATPDAIGQPPARPNSPFGIYAVVPVEDVVNKQPAGLTQAQSDTDLITFYKGLLDNPAVAGLTLQVHWDTLNPNAPTDTNPYFWNYVDDAFTAVGQWNNSHPTTSAPSPKTVQLIVTPGFHSPKWVLSKLKNCDGLFDSTLSAPASDCGKATFTNFIEDKGKHALPMPWNDDYKSDWKTFLTALAARYNATSLASSLVSIAVAGPTAASAEMLLPHSTKADQKQFTPAISQVDMWNQLLENHYGSGMPEYLMSDQAFIDEWNNAIDMYSSVFNWMTLVVTTADGLPNLSGSFTTPPAFTVECTPKMNMDCAAEATILTHFMDATVGGTNGKATQTSGMEASRVGYDLGVDGVKTVAQTTMMNSSKSTIILGGAQFNTQFAAFAAQEGCTDTFPPTKKDKPAACTLATWKTQADVPVDCIPQKCMAPGMTAAKLKTAGFTDFGEVLKMDPADLISPEQAAYNVLEQFFDNTPVGSDFGGTTGGEPLNYLQIYYEDIQYATKNTGKTAKVVETGGATVSNDAETMLKLASTKLFSIAEILP